MNGIWGKSSNYLQYSQKGTKIFNDLVDKTRQEFSEEYKYALDDFRKCEIYAGMRFASNDQVFWALQSNVSENVFVQEPKHFIFRVLLGACEADYYYTYEKEW